MIWLKKKTGTNKIVNPNEIENKTEIKETSFLKRQINKINILTILILLTYSVVSIIYSNFWNLYFLIPTFFFIVLVVVNNFRQKNNDWNVLNNSLLIPKALTTLLICLMFSILLIVLNNSKITFIKNDWTVYFKTLKIGIINITFNFVLILIIFIIKFSQTKNINEIMVNDFSKEKLLKTNKFYNWFIFIWYTIALLPILIWIIKKIKK